MSERHRSPALALLVLALAWATLAQYYFLRRPEYRWDGLLFAVLAALCFVLSWRLSSYPAGRRSTRPLSAPALSWIREHLAVVVLTGLGLLLSLIAARLAASIAWNQDTTRPALLWLLGIGAVLAAAFWPDLSAAEGPAHSPAPSQKRAFFMLSEVKHLISIQFRRFKRLPDCQSVSEPSAVPHRPLGRRKVARGTWLEVGCLALLTALALALRATALDRVPYTLAGDEAWFGLTARQVIQGELRNPFVTAFISMPTLLYWPMTWTMRLAGDNMVGIRLLSALVGTATIPLFYLFARDIWGRRTAWLGTVFLAAYEFHVHFSRLAINNAWDPLFAVLAFWLLERGLAQARERLRLRYFLLTGLVLGLGLYFYTGARLLPILVAACLLFFWRQRRSATRATRLAGPVLLLGLALLVAAGPILGYALAHPDDWNARMNQIGIMRPGWLEMTRHLTGKNTASILAGQFVRAAGAFHVFSDTSSWFGIGRPLLAFFPAVLAVLGMAWAFFHLRERRSFLLLTWFWAVVVAGGMLTDSPPTSQRLILAAPAVALLVATGLERLVSLARRLLAIDRRWADSLLALLIFAIAAGSIRFYFADYIPSRVFGSENGETATTIGHYVQDLDDAYRAYFFGPPRLYWGFGSQEFLAPQIEGQDVLEPLTSPPGFVDTSRSAIFVFLPERIGEFVWVRGAFPGGTLREFYDAEGRLRLTAYEVP